MAQTESQVVAAELERVDPKVPVLFERDAMFYANVEKRPVEKVSSRDMRIPLEIRPGGLFGYYDPAGGDLGRGEGPSFEKAVISTVSFKYAVEWQKKTQWFTDDSRKFVVDSVKHALANSMKEFRRAVDAQLMTGGDGILATIAVVAGTGPYTLTMSSTDGFGTQLLRIGHKVNIYNSTASASRTTGDERAILSIDQENKIVVLAGGPIAGIVAGDKVLASGMVGANPIGIYGVPYHHNNASTGTWLGLDRATYPEIRANRINAAGSLAIDQPRRALNKIGERSGYGEWFEAGRVDASMSGAGLRAAWPARLGYQQGTESNRKDGPLLRHSADCRSPHQEEFQLEQDQNRLRGRRGLGPS